MEHTSLTLKSYAKLNLCLWVYPPLPGNPTFHPIRGIFQTLSLHDTLTFRVLREKKCRVLSDSPNIPLDETNDIVKSYLKLYDRLTFGVEVTVTKRIPVGAGLGGGSSNAAAVLQCLNPFCVPEYTFNELQKLAEQIGSDVPYFLHGGTCSVMTGHGVAVKQVKNITKRWFLLIYPNIKVSTASVFNDFDRHNNHARVLDENFPSLENDFGDNDLKQTTMQLYPAVKNLEGKLSIMGLDEIYMTGSGSTLYIPVSGEKEGERLQERVQQEINDAWTCVTYTQAYSYQFEK